MKKLIKIIALFSLFLFISCQYSDMQLTDAERSVIETNIKSIVKKIDKAYVEQNVDKIINYFMKSDNLQTALNGKVLIGWDSFSTMVREWHQVNKITSSPTDYIYVDVLSRDVAVVAESGLMVGKDHSDNEFNQRWAWTAVFLKKGNEWKIVNAHESYSSVENE